MAPHAVGSTVDAPRGRDRRRGGGTPRRPARRGDRYHARCVVRRLQEPRHALRRLCRSRVPGAARCAGGVRRRQGVRARPRHPGVPARLRHLRGHAGVTPTESVGGERSALPGQVDALRALLRRNAAIGAILHGAPTLGLPQWYLGAGCLAQTVWNVLSGVPAAQNILDYDLVYFDAADLSDEAEARQVRRAAALFGAQGVRVDLKNQARVHLWYESRFGRAIAPYGSTRDAIDCWPTTATA